jgi:hypothetical protein
MLLISIIKFIYFFDEEGGHLKTNSSFFFFFRKKCHRDLNVTFFLVNLCNIFKIAYAIRLLSVPHSNIENR